MTIKSGMILLLLILAEVAPAFGTVTKRNLNFYIDFTDVTFRGGFAPTITRVYNSKSAFFGMFGWGWGIEFEKYIEQVAGGFIVHAYGGGEANFFSPSITDPSPESPNLFDQIVNAAIDNREVLSESERESFERRIKTDAEFRETTTEKYLSDGLIRLPAMRPGRTFQSDRDSHNILLVLDGGYELRFENGRLEYFNRNGRLIRVVDPHSNSVDLARDEFDRIVEVRDNLGRSIKFDYNPQGLVQMVSGGNGMRAIYAYNQLRELIGTIEPDGRRFAFEYDDVRRHNMTKIGYPDGTEVNIDYYPLSQNEGVKAVRERDGIETFYSFKIEKSTQENVLTKYQVTAEKRYPSGDVAEVEQSEYSNIISADGHLSTRRLQERRVLGTGSSASIVDDKETEYSETNGLPILVRSNGHETWFTYDEVGHTVRRETEGEIIDLKYDPFWGQVVSVQIADRANSNRSYWTKFKYDASTGQLTEVADSSSAFFSLEHNDRGLVSRISTRAEGSISCEYRSDLEPVEFNFTSANGESSRLTIAYNALGEVEMAKSDNARMIPNITSLLESLQLAIAPGLVSGRDCHCPDPSGLQSNEVKTIDDLIDVVQKALGKLGK